MSSDAEGVLRPGEARRVEGWTESDERHGWERNPEWMQDYWFEVFDEATRPLPGPGRRTRVSTVSPEPLIDGDTFICLTEDEAGRHIVRRYRLKLPVQRSSE